LGVALPDLTRHLLVLLFDVLAGALLLLSRAPAGPPQTWADVLVPLAASFFYLSYNVVGALPAALGRNVLPASGRLAASVAALHLSLAGFALAAWSLSWLGRSFAVLVSVREIVVSGPYRFVRHPMYLSYVLQMAGLVCAYGSLAVVALTSGHLLLTVYRARLEERRLRELSSAYRDYAARTGFLFPKWSGAPSGPAGL
jgi:protein-S-isoprenylcysteine O-methyltransferase Ste14